VALGPQVPADPKEPSAARDSRAKAAAWLGKSVPEDTTQAAAIRLFMRVREGEPAKALAAEIDQLLGLQNKDGGWGQLKDLASDAYATGQALYMLRLAGVKTEREEMQRAVAFLIANQRENGSWPMTQRAHPGATPGKNPVPITYLGSAWGTIGLARAVPAE
jgi:hypothetical protein